MAEGYQYMPRAEPNPDVDYPITVKYCGDKCRSWLEKHLPEEFQQLSTNGAVAQAEAPPKGRQVRGGKGTIKKPPKQQIQVFKTSRGGKKFTTSVIGLSNFGIELKVASKVFGQKFATGSSVTGNGDEIMIQGDVKDALIDLLTEKWPEIDEDLIEDMGEMKR